MRLTRSIRFTHFQARLIQLDRKASKEACWSDRSPIKSIETG